MVPEKGIRKENAINTLVEAWRIHSEMRVVGEVYCSGSRCESCGFRCSDVRFLASASAGLKYL